MKRLLAILLSPGFLPLSGMQPSAHDTGSLDAARRADRAIREARRKQRENNVRKARDTKYDRNFPTKSPDEE